MSVTEVTSRFRVSRDGIQLIKSLEGFRPGAVARPDGGWVIGYGHTKSARPGVVIGETEADLLLRYDLLPVVEAINDRITSPLNQHQFDALASFALSIGVERFLASDVVQRINAGGADEAVEALRHWPVSDDAASTSLRRRAAERALFVADPTSPVGLAQLLTAALPTPEPASANDPTPSAEARAQAVATLLGEVAVPSPLSATQEPTPVFPSTPSRARSGNLAHATPLSVLQLSPYAAPIIGPLPDFQTATLRTSPLAETLNFEEPAEPQLFPITDWPSVQPGEIHYVTLVAPVPETTPEPANDPDASEPWPGDESGDLPFIEGIVGAEPEPESILRHEAAEMRGANGPDQGEVGAFLGIGLVGLVAAIAAGAAYFRLIARRETWTSDLAIIGGVLAAVGVICLAISAITLARAPKRRRSR